MGLVSLFGEDNAEENQLHKEEGTQKIPQVQVRFYEGSKLRNHASQILRIIYIAHNELNINYFVDARKRFAPIGLVSWHFPGPDCFPSTKLFSQFESKMFGRRRYCPMVGLCTSDKQPIPLKSIKNRYMICIYHLIFWPTIVWFCGYLYPLSKINPYQLRTRNSITSCPIRPSVCQ